MDAIMKYAILCFHSFDHTWNRYTFTREFVNGGRRGTGSGNVHQKYTRQSRSKFSTISSKSVGAISSERLVSPWKMRKFVSSVKEVTRNRHSAWLNLRRACSRWKEKEDSSYPRAMFKGCATPFYTSTIFSFFGALLEILIRLIKNRCIIFFPKTCFNNINNNQ